MNNQQEYTQQTIDGTTYQVMNIPKVLERITQEKQKIKRTKYDLIMSIVIILIVFVVLFVILFVFLTKKKSNKKPPLYPSNVNSV